MMRLLVRAAVLLVSSAAVPASASAQAEPSDRVTPGQKTTAHSKSRTPDVTMSGFETLADGSTRVFVELSRLVPYDTKVGPGTIAYVLRGAHVDRRNNYNPLVTVHFNTPVTSARLVPHGKDLWFVVTLRENARTATTHVSMDTVKDGSCTLRVEFPKGEYLPAGERTAPVAPAEEGSPAPPASH
ncbi:MAG: hypothetical protein M3O50_10335 [Myxococcota bacterium]|nr:hypothetical protein [Myxococcota bacterium]